MTLIAMMAINASMNLFGLLFEDKNADLRDAGNNKVDWSAFIYGSFAGIVPWIIVTSPIFFHFTPEQLADVPWWVWGILGSYFFMFNAFPINMYLQYA